MILDQERTNQCLSSRRLCAVCQHIRLEYSASNSPAPGMEDVATMTIFDSPKEDSKPGNRSRHESKASSISAVNAKKRGCKTNSTM